MSNELAGKRIAFLVANAGVEQVELTSPWQAVKDAGREPVLYAASLAAPDSAARGLRLAGLTAVAAGGLLGGHRAFRESAGPTRPSRSRT